MLERVEPGQCPDPSSMVFFIIFYSTHCVPKGLSQGSEEREITTPVRAAAFLFN